MEFSVPKLSKLVIYSVKSLDISNPPNLDRGYLYTFFMYAFNNSKTVKQDGRVGFTKRLLIWKIKKIREQDNPGGMLICSAQIILAFSLNLARAFN